MILLTLSPLNVSSEDDFFLRVWALTDVCSSSSDPESKLQKRYGKWFNYDINIYKMWIQNLVGLFCKKPDAKLNLIELTWHLFGKYYGSIKAHVINI